MDGGLLRPGFKAGQFDRIEAGEALEIGLVFPLVVLLNGDVERSMASAAAHVRDVVERLGDGLFHANLSERQKYIVLLSFRQISFNAQAIFYLLDKNEF
jgi:hypothetical protein